MHFNFMGEALQLSFSAAPCHNSVSNTAAHTQRFSGNAYPYYNGPHRYGSKPKCFQL
jgi:hypothetical protein